MVSRVACRRFLGFFGVLAALALMALGVYTYRHLVVEEPIDIILPFYYV